MSAPHTVPSPFSEPSAPPGTFGASDGSAPPVTRTTPHAYSTGLLVLRLVLGLTLAAHGAQKLFGWFGGHGIDGTAGFFEELGYPAARSMAIVAGLTEAVGGLGLAVGLLTPLAGAAVLGTMVNVLAVDWGSGFFAPEGLEYPLLLAAGAGALTLAGPGAYSFDRLLPGLRNHRLTYGIVGVLLGGATAAVVLLLRS